MKLSGLRDVISFFTLIPLSGSVEGAADSIYLLPVVSLIVGAAPALARYYLKGILGSLFASVASLVLIYLVTGILHLDGLTDFFDGLLAKGDRSEKLRVMKDPHIGAGGVIALIFFYSLMLASTYEFDPRTLIAAYMFFVVSDMLGRASIIGGLIGENYHEGLGSLFRGKFRKSHLMYYLLVSLILLPIVRMYYLLNFVGIAFGYLVYRAAVRSFGSSGGDVLGASAELGRLLGMMILCALL
ncbi:MAG: adenosylcobinamide-GDP ribazoletransferase [Nitrososphaeria archaeon]